MMDSRRKLCESPKKICIIRSRYGTTEGVANILNTDHGARSQTYKGWILVWLAFQSTGVIYGDIGTRYVFIPSESLIILNSRPA
jgi:KUP system potassium uptake protein